MTMIRDEPPLRPGDLVLVEFGPIRGTEQDGRRPAIVISAVIMNTATHRVIVCPITRNTEPWPSKVMLPAGSGVVGAVLTDQVRSIDQHARILRRLGSTSETVVAEVRYQLAALLEIGIGSTAASG